MSRSYSLFGTAHREWIKRELRQLKAQSNVGSNSFSRQAAVLIPLCLVGGTPSVLFTLRSPHLSSHSSQVSFPGGMKDPTDVDVIETALRETHEELLIDPDNVEILGTHQYAPDVTGKIQVTPVLGFLGEIEPSKVMFNKNEVSEVFSLSVAQLLDPQHKSFVEYSQRKGPMPVFNAGPHPVWGLTAILLDRVLTKLIAPVSL